jgi:hypothetical protein
MYVYLYGIKEFTCDVYCRFYDMVSEMISDQVDSSIISCDYLNLSLANEYVGDVTIPTQVIKYNQSFLQVDQPIRLQYSNQIKL